MEENKLILMNEGFKPKPFIEVMEGDMEEVLEKTGLGEIQYGEINTLVNDWIKVFKTINAEIIENIPEDFDSTSIKSVDIKDEVYKVCEAIGLTVAFIYYNTSKKDWFCVITEYIIYMINSIGSIAGLVFYLLTIQRFLQEDGIERVKSRKILHYLEKNYKFVTNHRFYGEVDTLTKIFPFELLNIKELDISSITSVLILYPNGILNRFVADHFPKLPKKISKQFISKMIDVQVKSAIGDFNVEEIWEEGNIDAIKDFLKGGIIHKNHISNYSLLNSYTPSYTDTIKKWIENQIEVLKDLNEVETIKIAKYKGDEDKVKIQAKYFALYHLILVELKEEKDFPRDECDRYNRKDIEAYAAKKYPQISSQGFYRAYINNNITDKEAIVSDNKHFKEKLSLIAKNNPKALRFLKKFPG